MFNISTTYKFIFTGIILLVFSRYNCFSASDGGISFNEVNNIEVETNAAYFKKNVSDIPDHLNLIEKAQSNNLKLDSIYVTEKVGHNYEKRKWLFAYENGQLKQREEYFFGESFDLKFDKYFKWEYNHKLELEMFEEYNSLAVVIDTVIRVNFTNYYYDNGRLNKRFVYINSGGGYSGHTDENGNSHYES